MQDKVDPGKPMNAVQRIICDPGLQCFEARKPGIFFTMLSRATTMVKKLMENALVQQFISMTLALGPP